MLTKTQNNKRLELEERLIRIDVALEKLSIQDQSLGPYKWRYKKAIIEDGTKEVKIKIENKIYSFYNVEEIKRHASKSLRKMISSAASKSKDRVSLEHNAIWRDLYAIYEEASRIALIDQLMVRRDILEREKIRIIKELGKNENNDILKHEKVLEHKRIKTLVEAFKKDHKDCTNEEAFIEISIKENKDYDAVKRNYYYPGKK
jgi:hypothetical protein